MRPCTSTWHLQRSTSTGTEGWRSQVVDCMDEETGSEGRTSPTFESQYSIKWCVSSVVYSYKVLMFLHYSSLSPWWWLKHSLETLARSYVGIGELSLCINSMTNTAGYCNYYNYMHTGLGRYCITYSEVGYQPSSRTKRDKLRFTLKSKRDIPLKKWNISISKMCIS